MNQASGPKPTGSGESGLHFMKKRKSRGAALGPGRAAESSAEKLRGCQHRRTRFARDGAELPPATFSGADSDRRRSRAKRLGCADATPAATHRNSPHTTTVCRTAISAIPVAPSWIFVSAAWHPLCIDGDGARSHPSPGHFDRFAKMTKNEKTPGKIEKSQKMKNGRASYFPGGRDNLRQL